MKRISKLKIGFFRDPHTAAKGNRVDLSFAETTARTLNLLMIKEQRLLA